MGERVHKYETTRNAEAKTLLRYATVADLKADAAELSELLASLAEGERAKLVLLLFGAEA